EKRIESAWTVRLESLAQKLVGELGSSTARLEGGGLRITTPGGMPLAGAEFSLRGGLVESTDPRLKAAPKSGRPDLPFSEGRPRFFSISTQNGTFLLAAERVGREIRGARISLTAVDRLLRGLSSGISTSAEQVQFEIAPFKRESGESLVGKLMSGMAEAR